MSDHTAKALRAHLFETIQAVKNGSLDADSANAISNAAKQIVEIEKTAIKYADTFGGQVESEFLEIASKKPVEYQRQKPALGFSN